MDHLGDDHRVALRVRAAAQGPSDRVGMCPPVPRYDSRVVREELPTTIDVAIGGPGPADATRDASGDEHD